MRRENVIYREIFKYSTTKFEDKCFATKIRRKDIHHIIALTKLYILGHEFQDSFFFPHFSLSMKI